MKRLSAAVLSRLKLDGLYQHRGDALGLLIDVLQPALGGGLESHLIRGTRTDSLSAATQVGKCV